MRNSIWLASVALPLCLVVGYVLSLVPISSSRWYRELLLTLLTLAAGFSTLLSLAAFLNYLLDGAGWLFITLVSVIALAFTLLHSGDTW